MRADGGVWTRARCTYVLAQGDGASGQGRAMIFARRTIAILAALVALLVVTGWGACRPESAPAGEQMLRYVPANTAFFAGVTQDTWAGELGAGSGIYSYLLSGVDIDPRRATAELGPAAGVVVALLHAQGRAAERGERPMASLGVSSDAITAAYTVEQSPVMRWRAADPRRFWQSIDAAERRAGTEAETERHGAFELRRYPLDTAGGPLQLVLATDGAFALAALHAPQDERTGLDEVLGAERPSDPLDQAVLDGLARSYGLVPGTVAFVDNERLLAALSERGSDALIARIARGVRATDVPLHPWLVDLGTAACRDEISLLPEYWPRTVLGMTDFEPAARRLEQRVVFESPHQRGLAALETLQGRIPALAQAPETVLGLGIGVDVSRWVSEEPATESAESDSANSGTGTAREADCPPIAAILQRQDASDGPPDAVRRILARAQGVGASIFRTPPDRGRAQRPGVASALMVTTEEPDEVRAALEEIAALEPVPVAYRQQPVAPWRAVRRSDEDAPGAGLLLSEAPVVVAQPPAGSDDAAATNALATLRYRHGVDVRATVTALEPWLAPLPDAQRQGVRQAVRGLDGVPFDLAADVRVGERGVELDLGIAPVRTAPVSGERP